MLKFVEINKKVLEYDPALETCKAISSLREIYINPNYIVFMRENTSLKQEVTSSSLIEGMDKNLSFTELSVRASGGSPLIINVVGSLEEIAEKCDGPTR